MASVRSQSNSQLRSDRIDADEDTPRVTFHVHPDTLDADCTPHRAVAVTVSATPAGTSERVRIPNIDPEDEARDIQLESERAFRVLAHLEKFQYASREHVITAILWHTGIRLGSLRAFDLGDFDREARALDLRHRPDTGTPLKNGAAAERSIAVGREYASVIADYIEYNRIDIVDEYGRKPLITSREGRYSEGAIRTTIYKVTQPCLYTDCPHDKSPDTCEWYQDHEEASCCPSSRSPHGVRRGAITYSLREDIPERVVTERMNVSGDVLDQHYDERTDREKMESRREFVEDL